MKILILQLTRLGDILYSMPAINAYKREFPNAEIHLLCRKRYSEISNLCPSVDKVHVLDTKEIVGGLYKMDKGIKECAKVLEDQLNEIKSHKFDKIFNFSFSPFSSYVTSFLDEGNETLGYSRHDDGTLKINDEISAFFYSQVGLHKANKVHLSHIFAGLMELQLTPEDWKVDEKFLSEVEIPNEYVVFHLGASQLSKTLSSTQWNLLIQIYLRECDEDIVIVGTDSELKLSIEVLKDIDSKRIHNFCGKTNINQLCHVISKSKKVIGGDSAPIHIASLCGIPVINFSSDKVKFWETGPLSKGSMVIPYFVEDQPHEINLSFYHSLKNISSKKIALFDDENYSYIYELSQKEIFRWSQCEWLYWGKDPELTDEVEVLELFIKISELFELSLEQTQLIRQSQKPEIQIDILSKVDDMLSIIQKKSSIVEPFISWYFVEKIKIGPNSQDELIKKYQEIYIEGQQLISDFLQKYRNKIGELDDKESKAI